MANDASLTVSAEQWLLEQIRFCKQHGLNASLQTNHCVEWIVAGEAQLYIAVDIPECVSRNYATSRRFRHRNLSPDDELLQRCLKQGDPLSELLWLVAWQSAEDLEDTAIGSRLIRRPPPRLIEQYPDIAILADALEQNGGQIFDLQQLSRESRLAEDVVRRFMMSARVAGALA